MKGIIAAIILIVAIVAVVLLVALGFISLPGLALNNPGSDVDSYPDSEYCDYTEMQILDMLELASGKNLDVNRGVSYVRALNMNACGMNDEQPSVILSYYRDYYDDWNLYYTDRSSGAGYTVDLYIWTNGVSPVNSTLACSVVVVDGITVDQAYGYETMVLTSDGTLFTYVSFLAWVNSS